MRSEQGGQGLIEVVFAIAVAGMVLAGVAGLLVKTMGTRTQGFDRKKAVKLAETVLENLVEEKRNRSVEFWTLTEAEDQTMDGFDNYVYEVDFVDVAGCDTQCARAGIRVSWAGSDAVDESLLMERLFRR